MNVNQILITGASGFIGSALAQTLTKNGYSVRGALRHLDSTVSYSFTSFDSLVEVGEIGPDTDWGKSFKDIDVIIHLAGRAHILRETSDNPYEEFHRVNAEGTKRLAYVAAEQSVKRLVYISSIGVNGNLTSTAPFTENDLPSPHNDYALSKWEAEQSLHDISIETGMEVVIVRPPLVYGPRVKANFFRLLQWVDRGMPLPLGTVNNRRSLIALDNLVDFLVRCLEHPAAAGETFLVSDGEDLSTPELIKKIALKMDKPTRIFPFPLSLLRLGALCLGKKSLIDRLCGSLQIDITKAKQILDWTPPVSVDEGLRRTVDCYIEQKENVYD